eukprot:1061014-Amphidinium_carterae.2
MKSASRVKRHSSHNVTARLACVTLDIDESLIQDLCQCVLRMEALSASAKGYGVGPTSSQLPSAKAADSAAILKRKGNKILVRIQFKGINTKSSSRRAAGTTSTECSRTDPIQLLRGHPIRLVPFICQLKLASPVERVFALLGEQALNCHNASWDRWAAWAFVACVCLRQPSWVFFSKFQFRFTVGAATENTGESPAVTHNVTAIIRSQWLSAKMHILILKAATSAQKTTTESQPIKAMALTMSAVQLSYVSAK